MEESPLTLALSAFSPNGLRVYRYRDGMLSLLASEEAGTSTELSLRDDDILLLCDASLYDYVPDDEIEYLLTMYPDPQEALRSRAADNGGDEEIPLALLRIGGGTLGSDDTPDDDGRWDWAD